MTYTGTYKMPIAQGYKIMKVKNNGVIKSLKYFMDLFCKKNL